jgi:hypothetical protein
VFHYNTTLKYTLNNLYVYRATVNGELHGGRLRPKLGSKKERRRRATVNIEGLIVIAYSFGRPE